MKPIVRYALLLSAALVAGVGVAAAQRDKPSAPPQRNTNTAAAASYSSSSSGSFSRGRGAGKFLAEYDANHDGKVTRDEMNKVLGAEFAQASGGGQTINQAQFVALRMKDLRSRTDQMFHRADWNGDNRLSLEEYLPSERMRFEYADKDGTGIILCGGRSFSQQSGGQNGYQPRRGRGGGGRGFCQSADLNHDGQVTRAEFDKLTQQEFAAAAKGGALSADGFYQIVSTHIRESNAKMFARLDRNHDGKLDREEFAESQARYFARLDANNDGVVTRDELYAGRRAASNGNRKPGKT